MGKYFTDLEGVAHRITKRINARSEEEGNPLQKMGRPRRLTVHKRVKVNSRLSKFMRLRKIIWRLMGMMNNIGAIQLFEMTKMMQ